MDPAERMTKHLADRGLLNEDGIGRKLRGQVCSRCRQQLVVGLDADRLALPARCDSRLLTPRGELHVLVSGGFSYALRGLGADPYLDYRSVGEIKAHKASAEWPVLGTHYCGMDYPEFYVPAMATYSDPAPVAPPF